MRELSTERIKIGEHILIDGVEYVAEEGGGCEECPEGGAVFCGLCPIGGHIVKVKKEPKYRPYKDTEEMIADWKERFGARDWPSYSMPLIWVVCNGWKGYIDGFNEKAVCVKGFRYDIYEVFRSCTYLDGSPCGKEVSE